ncbi:Uncharacterised protein [Legionella cherrii]|uniref:Uncharacterized protein n=1 Tax=Legionella cherrii TaxID=28084 RepID=A0ABY6T1W6_9GAMM|nr:Uncharacterised protein [Legionella cherrii]
MTFLSITVGFSKNRSICGQKGALSKALFFSTSSKKAIYNYREFMIIPNSMIESGGICRKILLVIAQPIQLFPNCC